jgi:hypothetical protein
MWSIAYHKKVWCWIKIRGMPTCVEVSTTELRVHGREALDWWVERYAEHGVRHGGIEERDGRSFIDFLDPEDQPAPAR